MSALTPEQVAALLEGEKKPKRATPQTPTKYPQSVMPGTIQVGPVHLVEKEKRCASKGCGSPTSWTLEGIPYCHVHLIAYLNQKFIDQWVIDLCECKSGYYSKHRVHNEDCPVTKKLKET
jgi:hypothetical protein